MRKDSVVFDFTHFSVPVLSAFADHVYTCMNGNPRFPSCDYPLENVPTLRTQMMTYYNASQSGNHEQSALMRQTKDELIDGLKKTGNYVDRIADGDDAAITSSGFHLAKQPAAAQQVELRVESGELSGSVVLKRQAVEGAKSYVWQYSTDGIAYTFAGASSSSKYTITGLTPVTKYYFQVAVVTTAGTSAFSDAVAKVVE